ncbi:c-type cytochrome [Ovoidimarina sediminis]|uniref:c-type cytochrome n=1 Tax=Ovoidimarina sediminis TaxID=3079856 RepID=UPI00290858DC|nr:cytochrome c [Rhodophyticola sp. MJ-SS7]MDU8945638.1 cytochrome c [Rhodophyticola sp. MJ-SS7]
MLRPFLVLLLTASPALAQDVVEGQRIFESFCVACHGPEGLGDGPMAPLLEVLPADLTALAERNGGTFPIAAAAGRIDGRDPILSHGGPMPLFGWFFEGEDTAVKTETGQPMMTSQGIADILAYLETIQR